MNSRIHCEVNFGAVDSMTLDVFAMSLLVIKKSNDTYEMEHYYVEVARITF